MAKPLRLVKDATAKQPGPEMPPETAAAPEQQPGPPGKPAPIPVRPEVAKLIMQYRRRIDEAQGRIDEIVSTIVLQAGSPLVAYSLENRDGLWFLESVGPPPTGGK